MDIFSPAEIEFVKIIGETLWYFGHNKWVASGFTLMVLAFGMSLFENKYWRIPVIFSVVAAQVTMFIGIIKFIVNGE